jgi:ClpA/ClpB-like protein
MSSRVARDLTIFSASASRIKWLENVEVYMTYVGDSQPAHWDRCDAGRCGCRSMARCYIEELEASCGPRWRSSSGLCPPLPPDQNLPPTPAASKVIRQSSVEAEMLGHDVIGTEHLLLAITRSENVAVAVLEKLGVNPALLRAEVIRVLGS